MSDWTDLGFPCVSASSYGYSADLGIARPAIDSAIPDQKITWRTPQRVFNVSCVVPPEKLIDVEAFFEVDAYDWFTMPLVSGGGYKDYKVRAIGPCNISYQSPTAWRISFQVELPAVETPIMLATQYLPEEIRPLNRGARVSQYVVEETRIEHNPGVRATQFAVIEIRQSNEY